MTPNDPTQELLELIRDIALDALLRQREERFVEQLEESHYRRTDDDTL